MTPPKPKLRDRYPQLGRLCAAYLNQDWEATAPTPEAVVQRFGEDAGPKGCAATLAEIVALQKEFKTENALDDALSELRCGYLPRGKGETCKAFLERVTKLLR